MGKPTGNKTGLIVITLILQVIVLFHLGAQNCVPYPEIEGPACGSCTPEGWETESSSPDLSNPTLYSCTPSESPTGGNVIHLFSNGSNDIEAVSTSFTIPDFSEGEEYYFSMYMMACGPHSVEVEIIINGEEYYFDSTEEWQNIELCLMPESADMDIFITVVEYAGNQVTNTLLDTGECIEDYCCTLRAMLEEEYVELCPGESFDVIGEITGETGSVDVEWTSEPSYGVDYLEDPESINTVLSIPENFDFDGETIIYTVTIEDSECQISRQFELEILTSEIPEFDIYICTLYEDYELPLTSLNDYSGTWSGNMDFDELGGQELEYTFSLDPGQDNCIQEWTYEYYIHPEEMISIDYPLIYCIDDEETYYLPEETEERVEGEWDEDKFTPDELGVGIHEFTFYPDQSRYCAQELVLEIEVMDVLSLSFEIEESYCVVADSTFLPDTSIEGVIGTWDPPFIDLNIPAVNQTAVFSSLDNACIGDYIFEYSVVEDLVPTFEWPDSLCRSSETFEPDSMSMNGYLGYWSPSAVRPDTIAGDSMLLTWFPLDTNSNCIEPSDHILYIFDQQLPSFTLPSQLCASSGSYILPEQSLEGIEGAWNTSVINTDTDPLGFIQLSFMPHDSYCAEIYTDSIELIDNTLFQISFNLQNEFCSTDDIYELPTVSDNGVQGSWSQLAIDPSAIQDSVTLIFTPEESEIDCYSQLEETFYIAQPAELSFDVPDVLCATGGVFVLPDISDEGIEGQWTEETYDPAVHGEGGIFQSTFTAVQGSCYEPFELAVEIIGFSELDVLVQDASSCQVDNGSFEITGQTADLDFSIDGGVSWQSEPLFENLPAQSYDLRIRYNDNDCVDNIPVEIVAPSAVRILELEIDSIQDCEISTAEIQCVANSAEVEFSIDDGFSWQDTGNFTGLQPGSYKIIARSSETPDCLDSLLFEINAIQPTVISDVNLMHLTDCGSDDGVITVNAVGEQLVYSIDEGISWQTSSTFEGLASGEYTILVRSEKFSNCNDTISAFVNSPQNPMIVELFYEELTSCTDDNGSIEIVAEGDNLEYSVDGGINWQSSALFENLGAGNYDVQVRVSMTEDCIDAQTAALSAPFIPIINGIEITDVSSCIEDNGFIVINADGTELEYSLDGQNWTSDNVIEGLDQGSYTLIVRDAEYTDCEIMSDFIIEGPEPFELLDIEIQEASLCNESDAYVRLELSRGGLEFSLDEGTEWQSETEFMDLAAGQYVLIVRDSMYNDCILEYVFDIVSPPCPCNELEISFTSEPVDCLDPFSGSISIEDVSGYIIEGSYTVVWNDGSVGLEVSGLGEGWQSYVIDYDLNCRTEDSIYIDSFDPISFDLLSFDQDCEGLGSIEVVNFTGGSGAPSYSIDGINFQDNTVFTSLSAQEYQIFVEDLFNCSGQDSAMVNDASNLQLDLPGVNAIEMGESTALNPLINQMTIDSFSWYPAMGIQNPGALIAIVAPEETTTYTLTIYFGNCIEVRSVTVDVLPAPDIYLGDIFSPNGDGNNDYFLVQTHPDLNVDMEAFRVFDRWGNLVFEIQDFEANKEAAAWDGTYNDQQVIPGVYVYTVQYRYQGELRTLSGTVTVIR